MLLIILYLLSIVGSLYYLYRSTYPEAIKFQQLDDQPDVSVIIPARNEEDSISRCLQSLTDQTYKNLEIILVDGSSEDNTVEIASKFDQVTIIKEPSRPDKWVGKPWACYQGYQKASGEILLFTDADTWHHTQSLETIVAELKQTNGFLSFLTTQELKSFWEHMLTIVFLIISITVRGTKGTSNAHIANGQYMMFTRSRYEQLGTHEVVAGSIIEDLAFATHAASKGYPPRIVSKKDLVKTRMYRNLSEIREGFGKNLALGVQQSGIQSIIGAGFITTWALGWIILLMIELIDGGSLTVIYVIAIVGGYILFAALLFIIENNLTENGTVYVLVYPVYYLVFEFIVITSMIRTFIFQEIEWKGHKYKI